MINFIRKKKKSNITQTVKCGTKLIKRITRTSNLHVENYTLLLIRITSRPKLITCNSNCKTKLKWDITFILFIQWQDKVN